MNAPFLLPEQQVLKEKHLAQNKAAATEILLRMKKALTNSYPTEESDCSVSLSVQEIDVEE